MLRPGEWRFHYASVGESPSRTLHLLRNLADSTDHGSLKQQIAATIAYVSGSIGRRRHDSRGRRSHWPSDCLTSGGTRSSLTVSEQEKGTGA
jgi:hypothetical protein